MRKSLLSFLLLMLCMVCSVANPVTPEQAQQKAKAFLVKRGMAASATLDLAYQGKQQAHQNGAPAKNACYYVFNNGHNAGFVIVAGDDCAEDVLGYATDGSFDADNIPDNMQAFLQGYAEEIAAARALGANNANNGDENVEVARKVVAPLIETHWNQYDPYNLLCINNSGQLCVTGCVATALAQVMYYYQWPKSATTEIPKYDSRYGDHYDALPSTTFDWAKMKPVYMNTGNDDEDSRQAVAKLMRYCGQAVTMNYSPGSSGGYESSIPNALKNYFGYPGNPSWELRSGYTTEEWDELIYNELKFGQPVLYGARTSGDSGHEFICDGYDGHGLYHINWGWGGLSDGYFRLQALRPSSQGAGGSSDCGGYSLNHDAIIGMCSVELPSQGEGGNEGGDDNGNTEDLSPLETVELSVQGETTFDYTSNSSFSDVSVKFRFARTGEQNGIDVGFGLFKDEQEEPSQSFSLWDNQILDEGIYYTTNNLFYALGYGLDDGTYQIKGLCRLSGEEKWMENEGSDRIYIEVEIANGKATFTNVKIDPPTPPEPVKAIEVFRLEQRFDIGTDLTQIRAYVSNTGEVDYSSSLHLLVDGTWVAQEGVYLPVGGEDYVDFFFDGTAGSHVLTISTTNNGSNPIYSESMAITDELPNPLLTVTSAKLKNVVNDKQYGRMMEYVVTFKNNSSVDYNTQLTKYMYVKNPEGTYSGYNQSIDVSIPAGEEKTITFTHELAIGDVYWVYISDVKKDIESQSSWSRGYCEEFGIAVVPGVIYWKGGGERFVVAPAAEMTIPDDAVAISLEDLGADLSNYSITIPTAKYPIVYVAQSAETPAAWDNVVKGGTATQISLDDDYDFFVPKRFFAKEVRYSCLPEVGADGRGGWQTITLPFTVEKVTSGNKVVDWYHGNDTEEKDFWVREFKKVVGNTVKFADAEVWVPNVPYIFAVPGDHWGPQYDLTNKEMDFSATNVWVEKSTVSAVVSDNYEFIGISGGMTPGTGGYDETAERMENAYVLNEKGTAFVSGSSTWQKKHNLCYFTINDRTIDPPARLNIGTFDETDGICMPQVTATDGQQVDVYTIDGMKVTTVTVNGGMVDLGRLPKGVYIVEGKKIVR